MIPGETNVVGVLVRNNKGKNAKGDKFATAPLDEFFHKNGEWLWNRRPGSPLCEDLTRMSHWDFQTWCHADFHIYTYTSMICYIPYHGSHMTMHLSASPNCKNMHFVSLPHEAGRSPPVRPQTTLRPGCRPLAASSNN